MATRQLSCLDCLQMSKNPLHVLQKGLVKLKDSVKGRNVEFQWLALGISLSGNNLMIVYYCI
jgi:hypothetical protein